MRTTIIYLRRIPRSLIVQTDLLDVLYTSIIHQTPKRHISALVQHKFIEKSKAGASVLLPLIERCKILRAQLLEQQLKEEEEGASTSVVRIIKAPPFFFETTHFFVSKMMAGVFRVQDTGSAATRAAFERGEERASTSVVRIVEAPLSCLERVVFPFR
jgi:hypothetical protein